MIEVQLPDGNVLQVDAPDEQSAAAAAKSYMQKNRGLSQQEFSGRFGGESGTPIVPPKIGAEQAAQLNLGQGLTAGFSDELAAATSAGPLALARGDQAAIEDYNKKVALYRGLLRESQSQNPALSLGSEIGGTLATLPLTGGIGGVGLRGAALGGAATGALYGAGTGEGLTGKIEQAGLGGAGGAILGPAAYGVGRAASAVFPARQAAPAIERASINLGVPIPAGVASESPIVQRTTQAIRSVPLVGGTVDRSIQRTQRGLEDALVSVETGLGGQSSSAVAGDTAKTAIKDWIGPQSRATLDRLYTAAESQINQNATSQLSDTAPIVSAIARRIEASGGRLPETIQRINRVLEDPNGATYQAIKDLRTYIQDMRSGSIVPDIEQGFLKQLNSSLTNDLKNSVTASGGNIDLWNKANSSANRIINQRRSLAKIVGVSGDAPAEQVFSRLKTFASSGSSADIAKLQQVKSVIGSKEWDQFASGIVGNLGKSTALGGEFSPDIFVTQWSKLSDAGKRAIFSDPRHLSSLNDIATLAQQLKKTGAFRNTSNTATVIMTGGGLGAAGLALYDPEATLKTAAQSIIPTATVAALLTRPAGTSVILRYLRATLAGARSGSSALVQSAQRKYASDVGTIFPKGIQAVSGDQGDQQAPRVGQ